ncbi:MAG: hypothetical protein ACKO1X_05960, partial [Acidimicrobiales bacterium]
RNSQEDPLVRSFSLSESAQVDPEPLRGAIELRKLSFGFDPISAPFISGLDLTIPAGSSLAIVGDG